MSRLILLFLTLSLIAPAAHADSPIIWFGLWARSLTTSGIITRGIQLDKDAAASQTITIVPSSSLATSYTLTLPLNAGLNGQYLSTDGAGVLTWTSLGGVPAAGAVYSDSFTLQSAAFTGNANELFGITAAETATEAKAVSVGTSGTNFAIANSAGAIAFNLPDASATARGVISTGSQVLAGAKTFTSPILLADGSASTPSLTFSSDPNLGVFRLGVDNVGFTANGSQVGDYTGDGSWTWGASNADLTHTVNSNKTVTGAINNNINSYINRLITSIPFNRTTWTSGPTAPGSAGFIGGVLLPNGKVFLAPYAYSGSNTLYNPATNAWETGPTGPGSNAFQGAVSLPNGKVFVVPNNYTGTNTLYNPATNAWETGPAGPGSDAFQGGVLLPNGKVFLPPKNYTGTNTIYNPATNAWETGPAGPGSGAFVGGVLLPNGKVFAVPYNYTGTNTIYNPATNAWETGPAGSGSGAYHSGVLLPNGKVFVIPFNYTGTNTLYNPATNAWETGPAGPGSFAYASGVLLPNGKVFVAPFDYAGSNTIYNPATNAWETGPTGPGGVAFQGCVLLTSGQVFMIPFNYGGSNMLYNPATTSWPYGKWMLHQFFNKF